MLGFVESEVERTRLSLCHMLMAIHVNLGLGKTWRQQHFPKIKRGEDRTCLPRDLQPIASIASGLGLLHLLGQIILDPYLLDRA